MRERFDLSAGLKEGHSHKLHRPPPAKKKEWCPLFLRDNCLGLWTSIVEKMGKMGKMGLMEEVRSDLKPPEAA